MTIRVRQNAPQTLQFTATAEGHELPLAMPQPQGRGPRPARLFRYRAGRLQGADADGLRAAQGLPLESVGVDVVRDASEERKGSTA